MAKRRRAYLAYLALFGAAGWAALLAATYLPGFGPAPGRSVELLPFTLFFLVILGTRGLAFEMLPGSAISLDSAFYISAVICLGPLPAGRLVALALTLESLLRLLGAETGGKAKRSTPLEELLFVVYFGGMSGALLMLVGWLFGVDGRHLIGRPDVETEIAWRVVALGMTFIGVHYLVQGVRLRLSGLASRDYLRRMAAPGVVAEASLLPLAIVVVILFRPDRPLGLVLLGATYLLINLVFNRLSATQRTLRQRVSDLETLNRTARALSTLQQTDLVEAIARATLAAVPEAEILALSRPDGDGLVIDCFDRAQGEFKRVHASRSAVGVTCQVLERGESLFVGDLRATGRAVDDSGVRSWLGVPIVVHGETQGVLSVQSRERDAFSRDRVRLLEALGAQVAVAMENARLYELATVDGLTGLYVRRYFDTRLKEEMERSRRFGAAFSLIILDIDDFKILNDTHGHQAGDRVLREIATVARRTMRGIDLAARYGGEEFAFILPRTAIVDAHAVAERIRQDVADLRFVVDGAVARVTVSLGIACYPDSGEGGPADLVRRADVALYRAKATGKNRVELYWAVEDEPAPSRRAGPAAG